MNQSERRIYLINELIKENREFRKAGIPSNVEDQKTFLRGLMNIRMPSEISEDFLKIQDKYLQQETEAKGITCLSDLNPIRKGIYLWQGDITTLRCGAIVNAANSGMTGCYVPCHGCIDNAIHTYAGIQLRMKCNEIMEEQGYPEPEGGAKITPAYNLPCDYIIHTVGPIVRGEPTKLDEDILASCYNSCLELAEKNGIKSIAFCCISTGEFHFPNERAAQIAVEAVNKYRKTTKSEIEVIFDVWKEKDLEIYRKLLG